LLEAAGIEDMQGRCDNASIDMIVRLALGVASPPLVWAERPEFD